MTLNPAVKPTLHRDTFSRDNLPPAEEWPELLLSAPELQFPDQMNCAALLLDVALQCVSPDKVAILQNERKVSYAELARMTNQMAHTLVTDCGVISGNRILLHGPNSPELFAAWLATIKVGAIAVSTMPMLRSRELWPIVEKAQIKLAISAENCAVELVPIVGRGTLKRIVTFGAVHCELERLMVTKPTEFDSVATSADDVCLIAFTSGTTGEPKATMHFHRDVLAICQTFAKPIIPADGNSIFTGTPPIAFTFGLGALLIFPLYFRAAIALPSVSNPAALLATIQDLKATHVFTAPTAYKQMANQLHDYNISSIQVCVSAGEALSEAVSNTWLEMTGVRIIDGIGSTEMLHIFISEKSQQVRPGSTGRSVPGYEACIVDSSGQLIQGAGVGRLGIKGPTGCRYLSDSRQKDYVVDGWNLTGDLYRRDDEGCYWHIARVDDMIVSSGYNIAGPEVEHAMSLHPDVQECAVIGWPDEERGQIVKAVVVPRPGVTAGPALVKALQEHIKRTLAPYKYPRSVEFSTTLPKTPTGKLRRNVLRQLTPPLAPRHYDAPASLGHPRQDKSLGY